MLRQPAVAGYFYQGSASALRDQIEHYLVPTEKRIKALGILAPHAGLVYSGPVAGAVYSRIVLPGVFVLIGPNHTGLGAPVSIMSSGRIQDDALAHLREHSLEVQLPFIQYQKESITIVPIQMMDTRFETCVDLGNAVAAAVREEKREVLIVASSDMSHYVPAAEARTKDQIALDRILELDARGLYDAVRREDISMCGYGPAVAMLTACKALGATRAELVKYANSGDVSGDYDQVVGYAGVVVSRT
jgi:predicted class III extradiol MEMO1 family dioxygenase